MFGLGGRGGKTDHRGEERTGMATTVSILLKRERREGGLKGGRG